MRSWEASIQGGLPLIAGSEFVLADGLRLVLLAEDHGGYSEICRLITLGRRRAGNGAYLLNREDFASGAPGCQLLWVPPAQVIEADAGWVKDSFDGRAHIAVDLRQLFR